MAEAATAVTAFLVAAGLTALMSLAGRLHLRGEHIAGLAFLFGAPWGWLLDQGWFGNFHSPRVEKLIGYAVILWIPCVALFSLPVVSAVPWIQASSFKIALWSVPFR